MSGSARFGFSLIADSAIRSGLQGNIIKQLRSFKVAAARGKIESDPQPFVAVCTESG
jgi:hypothetical protein